MPKIYRFAKFKNEEKLGMMLAIMCNMCFHVYSCNDCISWVYSIYTTILNMFTAVKFFSVVSITRFIESEKIMIDR